MKAIILAAGRGSRMGQLTNDKPKCLLMINGKTLIELQITAITNAGIKDIAIVTGYKAEMLKSYGNYHFHNSKWAETNMVASLLYAKEWLDEDDCIVSYSDIFYRSKIVKDLIACTDEIAIAYDPKWLQLWSKRFENPLEDAETFRIDSNGYVIAIGQRAVSIAEIQGQYMGLLKFKARFFSDLTKSIKIKNFSQAHMTCVLQKLIELGVKVKGIENNDCWEEFDSQSDFHLSAATRGYR